jgi:hypothetical protein
MKHWWDRNEVELGGYTKNEVEDYTGCIPLLLDSCVVNGKIDLHVQIMMSLWEEAALFVSNIKENENAEAWEK